MTATAIFPAALLAPTNVGGPVVNRQQLTQSGSVISTDATITATVAIPAAWPTNGRVVMENEVIWYGGKSGSTLTSCLRGQEGTTAAGHTAVAIEMDWTADQFNQLQVDLTAVQTKVGIDGSAVTTTLDYKLSGVTGTDKAVSKTGTETLTNKTLTSPVINSPTIGSAVTLSSATTDVIGGATTTRFRNAANNATNLQIDDAGAITVRGAVSGVTTLTATTLAGTLSTAAQPNVTSLGTLTSLTTSGDITVTSAVSRLIPGATSFAVRDTANANDNLLVTNVGDVTVRARLLIAAAASKLVPGVTSMSLRNNADSADNLLITDAGAITVRSTISGVTTLTATTLAGTLSTAAQPNVTSLGTLTGITTSGTLTFTTASGKVVPGTVQLSFRDNADANDNLLIANNGDISVRARLLMLSSVAKVIGGATSVSVRDNADANDNLLITNAGDVTSRAALKAGTNLFKAGAQILSEFDAGDSGTAKTINWNNSDSQRVRLTGNVTFTLTNPQIGMYYTLRILQDTTGGRTVTWPASVKHPSGSAPVQTSTLSTTDVWTLYWDGTNYYAGVQQNYSAAN